jgi:preprotein translocase subunit YajC
MQSQLFANVLPLFVVFVIFFFLVIKPQQKKALDQKNMVSSLQIGDKIILTSGIVGHINEIIKDKDIFKIEIAKNTIIEITNKDFILSKYEK